MVSISETDVDKESKYEEQVMARDLPLQVHSVFSPIQKKLIVLTASTAALLSPLASNIYLPALNLIAADLHVSDSQINFTVTSYLV